MVVSFGDGVKFVIVLHQVWKKHPVHQDFLGFYVVDSHRMSAQTHGLLGMQCSDCRPAQSQGTTGSRCTKPCSHAVPGSQHARPFSLCINPERLEAVSPWQQAEADH